MAAVTESNTENRDDLFPHIEVVKFTTTAAGDYYDSKKFGQVVAAFASQQTADGNEVRVTWSTQSNGVQRIALHPEIAITTGWLTIFGRK